MVRSHDDDCQSEDSRNRVPPELTQCSVTGGLRAGAVNRLERPDNVPPRKRWCRFARIGARVCQLQSGLGTRPDGRVNPDELSQPSLRKNGRK